MTDDADKPKDEPAPLDVTKAIKTAGNYLKTVFAAEDPRDVRLEEVEFLDAEEKWLVTLSFLRRVPKEEKPVQQRSISDFLANDYRREYKSIAVNALTGQVQSIKMRSAV